MAAAKIKRESIIDKDKIKAALFLLAEVRIDVGKLKSPQLSTRGKEFIVQSAFRKLDEIQNFLIEVLEGENKKKEKPSEVEEEIAEVEMEEELLEDGILDEENEDEIG